MKILIVNLHSSRNAGDDVLTHVSTDLLEQYFPNATIKLAMNDPLSYSGPYETVGSFMTWIKPAGYMTWRAIFSPVLILLAVLFGLGYRLFGQKLIFILAKQHHKLLEAYFEADLVISSAGNFLYSSGRFGLAYIVAVYTLLYGWLLGKPVYTMPQTIGPLTHRWERTLLRWAIPKLRIVLVRDPISKQLLKSLGVWHAGCHLVPDVAFLYREGELQEGLQLLHAVNIEVESDQPLLGVTVINWQAQNRIFEKQFEYERGIEACIRTFITRYEGRVVLFSQVRGPTEAEDDRVPARRIYKRLADLGSRIVMIERDVPPSTLRAAYGLMDIFIGTRLHSNIFALSTGSPALMIQYQYKTRGIMQMLALDDWIVEISEANESTLPPKLVQLWEQRAAVRHCIKQAVDAAALQIKRAGRLIAADFEARQ